MGGGGQCSSPCWSRTVQRHARKELVALSYSVARLRGMHNNNEQASGFPDSPGKLLENNSLVAPFQNPHAQEARKKQRCLETPLKPDFVFKSPLAGPLAAPSTAPGTSQSNVPSLIQGHGILLPGGSSGLGNPLARDGKTYPGNQLISAAGVQLIYNIL